MTGIVAYPMHGQYKLSNEGYRTRDGHIIEWLGRFASRMESRVDVVSRPEPILLAPRRRIRGAVAAGTFPVQTLTWRVPKINPRHWWVRSAKAYPMVAEFGGAPAVTWNPFTATAPVDRNPFSGDRLVVLDLLDDWTIHHGFKSIRGAVEKAYARAFEVSDVVFANAEGTLDLARRFGRSDAELMTNGVDPDRFAVAPNASGPMTVGYVGKIGKRLDAQLVLDVCGSLPDLRFVFAGPFTDAHDRYRKLLSGLPNVEVLGDIHYDRLPTLMATFDLGWVPHSVGHGEVGGDAIKIYEYRAAGLPVLTTPIMGAGRGLSVGVHVIAARDQMDWLQEATRSRERLDRIPAVIPDEMTWRYKARRIAIALGMKVES